MSIEAMKQALEALETADEVGFWELQKTAITALRTAIEQAEKQVEPFGHFQYDVKLDAWVKSKTNNGVAFYTTPPAGQPQDLNGGHQLDVAGHASTATITKWSYRDCGSEGWFIAETVAAPGGLLPHQGEKHMTEKALDTQVGGGHYKSMAIQPVEYIHKNGIPYIEGCVIKYISRWRNKNGIEDLKKAKHFIDLLIELESK